MDPATFFIMTDYQSLTVKELKELVKDRGAPRGTLSKLKRKQDFVDYLTQPQEQQRQPEDEEENVGSEGDKEDEEDAVDTAAAVAADRNAKRPKGADAGDVAADKQKKKPKRSKKFDWRNSAAKKYLKRCFKDGVIPLKYSVEDGGVGPKAVWEAHCKDHASFKGMSYDDNFASRLRAVKKDSESKMARAEVDKANLTAFRQQHPVQAFNSLGEPRWEGSEAQCLLKIALEEITKLSAEEIEKQLEPKVLFETEPSYRTFTLAKFRDHIYQEIRSRRFLKYSEAEKMKPSKNKVMEE